MQKISYDNASKCYEIGDEYGGVYMDIREIKRLLNLIKKTYPNVIEEVMK